MFPFLRFSAVMASIVVASTAFGFGLGNALSDSGKHDNYRELNGISVFSSANIKVTGRKSRAIASLRNVNFNFALQSDNNAPAVNRVGPRPGVDHADLSSSCGATSSCLMAMN